MKNKLLFIMLFFGVALLPVMAQSNNGSGSFTTEEGFVLENNAQTLPYSFVINLDSKYSFSGLKDYFGRYNTQLTTIEYDASKRTLTMSIEKRAQSSWKLTDWNQYLEKVHSTAKSNLKAANSYEND